MPPAKRAAEPKSDPPDAAAGSSTDSSAADQPAPTGASGSGFISDPGPVFDSDQAAREPPPAPEPEILDSLWHEETVRSLLEAQGSVLHGVAGKGETDWVYTRDELRAIAGPLTRILNRYPATQAAAGSGDEIAVILGMGGYTMRSIRERKAALAAATPEEPEEQPLGAPVFPEGPPPPLGTDDLEQPPIPPSHQ